jgi:hypothetical protein
MDPTGLNAHRRVKDPCLPPLPPGSSLCPPLQVCRRLETQQEKVLPFWSINEVVPVEGTASFAAAAAMAAAATEEGPEDGDAAAAVEQQQAGPWKAAGSGTQPGSPAAVGAAADGLQRLSLAGSSSDGGGGGVSRIKLRLVAAGLRDDGTEVDEWDYLSR